MLPTNLKKIVNESNAIVREQYSNQAVALQKHVPAHLQRLIHLVENTPFSKPMQAVVQEHIISSYRETLEEVTLFNNSGRTSGAAELINWVKCEVEIAGIFFEGIYRYISNKK